MSSRSVPGRVGAACAALVAMLILASGANAQGSASDQSQVAGDAGAAVNWLNVQRSAAGAPPVSLDDELSQGDAAHANYLLLNTDRPDVAGLNAHNEDLSLPGASREGRAAGIASNISQGPYSVLEAMQTLVNVPLHRQGLLSPLLQRVGIGSASGRGGHLITAIDIQRGTDASAPLTDRPMVYPAPGQVDVPLSFSGDEIPNPLQGTPGDGADVGFAVSVEPSCGTLASPSTSELRDQNNDLVPVFVRVPGTQLDAVGGSRVLQQILMFPQQPLRVASVYSATVEGTCDSRPYTWQWSFGTTGASLPAVAVVDLGLAPG